MLRSVVPLTSPTEMSTSRPNFEENIVTIAATGAAEAVTSASAIVLSTCPRRNHIAPVSASGNATRRTNAAT